jgi:glycosyltransferase involved in cell wall biosynthesis
MIKSVDFIICTYNGSIFLDQVLDSILTQNYANLQINIIIVDNNSSFIENQKYRSIIFNFNSDKIILVSEPKPGLFHARKTGIEKSTGDLIIFVDDDNILDLNFLSQTITIFNDYPEVGACCGQNIATRDSPDSPGLNSFPSWFEVEKRKYACGSLTPRDEIITWTKGECWGAGMAIRAFVAKQILKIDNLFFTIGRNGNNLSSGDDTELSYWVIFMGYDLYFSNSRTLKHLITSNRLTELYLDKLSSSMMESGSLLSIYKRHLSTERRIRQKQNDLLSLIKSALKMIMRINSEWLFLYTIDSKTICSFFMSKSDYQIWLNRKRLRDGI